MSYAPPFTITPEILSLAQSIGRELGRLNGLTWDVPSVRLRKNNSIRTIQSSLAIEGNTLSLEQVTALFEGKRVLGPQKDILEVKNALEVYDRLHDFDAFSSKDMLEAHRLLMKGLASDAGEWREGGVAIFKGNALAHLPPPAHRVPFLMEELFVFLKESTHIPWLIKGCIFHYELEFIHPFSDGNGRMGRLWQQLVLMREDTLFAYISVEDLIQAKQQSYYTVLGECDRAGDSTAFIAFSLGCILEALRLYENAHPPAAKNTGQRLDYAQEKMQENGTPTWFSRKEYRELFPSLSSASSSRDLIEGYHKGRLEKTDAHNKTRYRFTASS